MNEPPSIYWDKTTGKNTVEVPFMSKEIMKELYRKLQDHSISRDEAVAKIWLSELTEPEKIIVAVNIGEFKERTKMRRWFYLKYLRAKHRLDGLKTIVFIKKHWIEIVLFILLVILYQIVPIIGLHESVYGFNGLK